MVCDTCGAPAVRTLCAFAFCHDCAEAILEPIRQRVLADESGIGWGEQYGPLRPDFGYGFAELACVRCGATWVGPLLEDCRWCVRAVERLRDWQAELVLAPPADVDPDDPADDGRLLAWRERLHVAVDAELISEHHAAAAWDRATRSEVDRRVA